MNIFEGHNWVYMFHIVIVFSIMAVIPMLYFIVGKSKMNTSIMEGWYISLIAIAVGMVIYHLIKLLR